MKIRYIADMHYDNEDIIAYDNRPFGSAEEMNGVMTERWNRVCGEDDLIYILGDFCGAGPDRWRSLLSGLTGRKFLITGNHDDGEAIRRMCEEHLLEGAAHYLEIRDGEQNVVLCHYPIVSFHDHYFGWRHLYGHVHTGFEWNMTEHQKRLMQDLYVRKDVCRMINAGAMLPYMAYTPRTLEELEETGLL